MDAGWPASRNYLTRTTLGRGMHLNVLLFSLKEILPRPLLLRGWVSSGAITLESSHFAVKCSTCAKLGMTRSWRTKKSRTSSRLSASRATKSIRTARVCGTASWWLWRIRYSLCVFTLEQSKIDRSLQDHDGSHIKGLLINFLDHFFPSLLKLDNFLVEFVTPIVRVRREFGLNWGLKLTRGWCSGHEGETTQGFLHHSRIWTMARANPRCSQVGFKVLQGQRYLHRVSWI